MSASSGEPQTPKTALPLSSFTGPIGELIGHRLLSPPGRPGLLASRDRFEILRLVGSGGMGIVLLARDSASGSQVAVKLIKPELANDAQIIHRFVKEAGHLQKLAHPNIIPVLEVCESKEGPYFVMPYCEKGNLAGRIPPGKGLDTAEAASVAGQIAEGLLFAHRRGIIHRDLKPANILLSEDGHARLSDFGLARTMFNDSIVDVAGRQGEGTAPYMSPAVAADEAEDTRCDIYAFGAILYEMLTGVAPYEGTTAKEVRQKILTGAPRPISLVNPSADPRLAKIAAGAMGRELRERYADMADVIADLQRAKDGRDPVGPRGSGVSGKPRRKSVWLAAALAAIVLGLVALRTGRRRTPAPSRAPSAAFTVSQGQPAPVAPTGATWNAPWGIAADSAGAVFVTDRGASTVSEIMPAGEITLLAGLPGQRGVADGDGPDARFIIARGIGVDSSGNLYVADAYRIRKMDATGAVSVLAGLTGNPGSADGKGVLARFKSPSGIAVSGDGTVYVADTYTIRKISSGGVVSTLAGLDGHGGRADGKGAAARFSDQAKGLAVDGSGTLYVADSLNHVIRKISPDGTVRTIAGTGLPGYRDGKGRQVHFMRPGGIAADQAGNLFVADTGNDVIRKIASDGTVTTLAGVAGQAADADGMGAQARFNHPQSLAVGHDGIVYVADTGNKAIRRIGLDGRVDTMTGAARPVVHP